MACKIRAISLLLAALLLAGCPVRLGPAPSAPKPAESVPAREGRPYTVIPTQSLVSILVFRGGALARAGHNHVIASHDVTGTVYVSSNIVHSSFAVRIPVASLSIDEPRLRALEGEEFRSQIPSSAREGTRRNMLSPAVLDGERYPMIELSGGPLEHTAQGLRARVRVEIRDQVRTIQVPLRYEIKTDEVLAVGELPLRQTELGLTPFSALLGALQVQDEMKVRFRVLARASTP